MKIRVLRYLIPCFLVILNVVDFIETPSFKPLLELLLIIVSQIEVNHTQTQHTDSK